MPACPSDLAAILRKSNGDLSHLRDLAKKAPASARVPLQGLTYTLPVANPGKIILLGLNYLEHVKEGPQRDNIPKFPTYFMRGLTSLTPHEGPIVRPKVSDTLDYEAELVIVVGKRAKNLTKDNAYSCIAGWSCFNDGSVREWQRRTTQWDIGKNFDATGGFGPWMVTADDVPAGGKGLKIESRLNGKVMQSDNTDNMMFPVAETLADLDHRRHARARRPRGHRHAVGRRPCAQAAGLHARRRCLRDRDRRRRPVAQSDRGRALRCRALPPIL